MSATQRRITGLLIVVTLIIGVGAYTWWRLQVVGREGWVGVAYMPDVKTKKGGPLAPSIAGFKPGMIFTVYPGGPADRAGIERMSRLISINGIPISDMKRITSLANKTRTGDVAVFRTSMNGVERDHRVRFESPASTPIFAGMLAATFLVALAFLLIGTFVFWRLPTDSRAVIFFAMTLFAAVSFVASAISQFEGQNTRGMMVEASSAAPLVRPAILGLASLFFAPLLLHLALIFPKPRPVLARGRTLFAWIYGFPLYFCLCAVVGITIFQLLVSAKEESGKLVLISASWLIAMVVAPLAVLSLLRIALDMRRKGIKEGFVAHPLAFITILLALASVTTFFTERATERAHSPGPIFVLTVILVFLCVAAFAAYPLATLIALFRSYRDSGVEERRQVKWPLWGTMIAVGTKIVLMLIGLAIGFLVTFGGGVAIPNVANVLLDALSRLVYVIVPVCFAVAILKYRLMNIDVIIRRTVLYSILSAVVFVLYGVLVGGVGTLLIRFAHVQNTTMVIASTIVVALVAVPLRNRLQQMVDRNLFRERRDYPLALRNIASAIASSPDINEFLRVSAEQIQQALQSRMVIIALRRDREFVAAAKVGVADDVIGNLRVPVDIDISPIPEPLRNIGATLLVPAKTHRDVLALLVIGSKLSDEDFSADDLEFLTSAASQIAVGAENLRLRDEEVEYEQARAMQQILLPTRFPQLDGFAIAGAWQPARSVGGDYFDTLPLGNGKAAICIADVAGKGMPAALLMANLQAAVKATASQDATPTTVCERVKTIVGGNLAGGKFITFFYGLLDSSTRTFTYSNAGHNPPILVRANLNVERLARGGPAICRLFKDIPHEQESVTLRPGDRLLLFTDGVSEARHGEEEFGEDRLIEFLLKHRHLNAEEMKSRILDQLRLFTGGDFGDDVTLVVIAAD